MQCLYIDMKERNYLLESEQELLKIVENCKEKPKLLIHVCCGPCSIFPLRFLSNFFKISVLFYNPNIYPNSEFEKRYNTLLEYINILKNENINIEVIKGEYNHIEYMKDLLPLKNEKEGGKRCLLCYEKRLRETFILASKNNFDYVCTVMTSSRQKSSKIINQIAEKLSSEFKDIKYFYSDFKKHGWSEEGYKKARDLGLYLQEYCGCEFSINNK